MNMYQRNYVELLNKALANQGLLIETVGKHGEDVGVWYPMYSRDRERAINTIKALEQADGPFADGSFLCRPK